MHQPPDGVINHPLGFDAKIAGKAARYPGNRAASAGVFLIGSRFRPDRRDRLGGAGRC